MLERDITITPAFDYILNDIEKAKYGRGCAEMWFKLTGDCGAITFSSFTGWYLPETIKAIPNMELRTNDNLKSRMLAIHSKTELPEMNTCEERDYCEYTKGKCYTYSYLSCCEEQKLMDLVTSDGSEKLFEELEKIYKEVFKKEL